MIKIPEINKKVVCISTDKSSQLAASVSSYFIEDGVYFPVFNFLDVREPHKVNIDYTEDGFIGHILGNQASVYINNLIRQINPEFVIFAGLNNEQKSYFTKLPQKVIHVDSLTDIDSNPEIFQKINVYEKIISGRSNIVIIEDGEDLSTVIAENLACAMRSDILHVKKTENFLSKKIAKYIHEWKKKGKYYSYIKIENLVKERVQDVDFSKYEVATFFTNGLPYGLILDNPIPFCYIHKRMRDDIVILNSIIYSQKSFGTAVSFAIEDFVLSEPKGVSEILKQVGILPMELFSSKATAFNFENYVSYLPYDILHISSHGGIKTNGYYIKQDFKDRDGKKHTVEYYEVPTFTSLPLDNSDNVAVYIKDIYMKFDGSIWMSEELENKKIPSYVFNDMFFSITQNREKIQRQPVNNAIIDSATITCADGSHQGQLNCLAGQHGPVVFNNSCWSWSEISTFFLAGGAKAYIGTLWEISDKIATDAAIKFYKDILKEDKTIVDSIWEINKNISPVELGQENIFFLWCLPFTIMKKAPEEDFDNFIKDIINRLVNLILKVIEKNNIEANENIIKFIIWSVYKEFGLNIIDLMKEDIKKSFNYNLEVYSPILKRSNF